MATHSSVLAWRIPGMGEPGGLPSPGSQSRTRLKRLSSSSSRHIRLFATLWTVARQVPLSIGFIRQEYWSGLPFPPPGDLPFSGIEPESPMSPELAGRFFTTEPPGGAGFDPWVRKISWRKKWQPTPVFLPGKSLGQRSLAGYSPWGHRELDTI